MSRLSSNLLYYTACNLINQTNKEHTHETLQTTQEKKEILICERVSYLEDGSELTFAEFVGRVEIFGSGGNFLFDSSDCLNWQTEEHQTESKKI